MAASKLWQCFDFETALEKAAVANITTAFADNLSDFSVVRTLSESELTTPRVECKFELGASNEIAATRGGGSSPSTFDFKNYTGTFNITIITDNAQKQANHAEARATCRTALALSSSIFDSTPQTGTPQLTGTVTAATSSPTNNCIASGAAFTSEIAVGDTIKFVSSAGTETNTVATVTSDTQLLLTNNFEFNQLGANMFRVQSYEYGPALNLFTVNHISPDQTSFDTDGDFNVSVLSYSLILAIREDAWPS
jgi:hypothetical protein